MIIFRTLWVILIAFLSARSAPSYGLGSDQDYLHSSNGLTLFDCRPDRYESMVERGTGKPFFCVSAKARAEVAVPEGGYRGYKKGFFSEVRSSYVYSSLIGVHGVFRGEALWMEGRTIVKDMATDLAVIQLGNLAFSQIRLVFGRGRLPLGINRPAIKGWYGKQNQLDLFSSPVYVVYGTLDNRQQISLDWGIAGDSPYKSKQDEFSGKRNGFQNAAASFRFIYDFAILGSTRSVLTLYGQQSGIRRAGLGLLTIGTKRDETHLELMREISSPDGKIDQFKQLIRFGYKGPIQNGSRWSFQLDDELKLTTRAAIFYEQNLWDFTWVSQGIGYRRGWDSLNRLGWTYLLGLGTLI